MNILSLKYFITLAATENYSETAEQLFTSQSTVSKQIISLEKELNTQLVDRTKRKIQLTSQGFIFLEYAKKIMANYDELYDHLASCSNYDAGSLSIASIPVMAQYDITGKVAAFKKAYPNIHLVIDEREGSDIMAALKNREYDLAFMREEMLEVKCDILHICSDYLVAVLPLNHPLAHEKEISLLQLANENFLLLNKRTLLYTSCIQACQRAGFVPTVTYTGTRTENILELVSKGMGISLMMNRAVAYSHNTQMAVLPLKELIESNIALIRTDKKHMSPSARIFWDFMKNSETLSEATPEPVSEPVSESISESIS